MSGCLTSTLAKQFAGSKLSQPHIKMLKLVFDCRREKSLDLTFYLSVAV